MSRKSRGMLAIGLLVAAALTITACGSTNGGSPGGGGSGSGGAAVTVTFWQQQFEDYQQTWFKKYVDQFNASQDKVFVDYQVVPADTWDQKLQAAQAANTQPDIATTNYGRIKADVAQGMLAPLDDYLTADSFADIKQNVAPFITVGGQHYAYPLLVEPSIVLYYRTDLVRAAGLDPNSPPKSWADLIDWAKKLTTADQYGITVAYTPVELAWSSWGFQWNSCGHWPITDDWSASRATEPCFADVAQFYTDLYQGKLMPQASTVSYTDATPYGTGQVAMMVNGSWAVGQLKNTYPDLVDKTAVAPMPTKDGGSNETTATLGGWTLTLDAKSKHPTEAASFISYLVAGDPNIMADFFKNSGYSKYTVRTSVDAAILKDDPAASEDPFMKVISQQIVPYGVAEPVYPLDISTAMATAIQSAMTGNQSVADALATADQTINQTIQTQQLKGTQPQS